MRSFAIDEPGSPVRALYATLVQTAKPTRKGEKSVVVAKTSAFKKNDHPMEKQIVKGALLKVSKPPQKHKEMMMIFVWEHFDPVKSVGKEPKALSRFNRRKCIGL